MSNSQMSLKKYKKKTVQECSHMTKFSPIFNIGPVLFSIVSMVTGWISGWMGDKPIQPVTIDTMLNNDGPILNIGLTFVTCEQCLQIQSGARLHSSRMRSARLLPISPSMHCSRGCVCSAGGVCSWGCLLREGCMLGGGGCLPLVPWGGDIPACNEADPREQNSCREECHKSFTDIKLW